MEEIVPHPFPGETLFSVNVITLNVDKAIPLDGSSEAERLKKGPECHAQAPYILSRCYNNQQAAELGITWDRWPVQ